MHMFDLRTARKQKGLTQKEAALRLDVSQAYLSMLENDRRPVPAHQLARVIEVYGLPPTALPFRGFEHWAHLDSGEVAAGLASLGYPGFAYMNDAKPLWNPAELLVAALTRNELESRVAEGLPWLAYALSNMDWDWVLREAKTHDVTNRLGCVVTLARMLAERRGDSSAAESLETVETCLQRSTLVREDTFCHDNMTQTERRWLRENRPAEARRWRMLSDLDAEHLVHVV